MDNKYNKSIIYQITCNNPQITDTYIGSTTDFKKRINTHKSNCNNENSKDYNLKVYQYIRENGNWDNFTFNILEEYSCENKKQLESQERYYIELLKPTLNGRIPTRTVEEYYEDNRDKLLEYQKEYQKDNKDKKLEYDKQYYINNKDKILEKVNCDICNSIVSRKNLAKHKKTLKCIKFQKLI